MAVSDALATGQQREPLDSLAGRSRLDIDAGREHVVGIGQHEPALAAGEEPADDRLEFVRNVGIRGTEDLLHPVVHFPDHRQQVTAGLLQVLKLRHQECVPLLERSELFQRERIDLAELIELPLGPCRPALRGFPVVADRELPLALAGDHYFRPVLRHEHICLGGELLQRAGGDLFQLQLLGCPGKLRAVRALDDLLQLIGRIADLRPDRLQLSVPALVRVFGLLPLCVGGGNRQLDAGECDPGARCDRAGHYRASYPPLGPRRRPGCRLPLGQRGRNQRFGPAGDGALPLFHGANLEPCLHLCASRGDRRLG